MFNIGECWDSDLIIKKYYESDLDSYFYFPSAAPDGFISSSLDLEGAYCTRYLENAIKMVDTAKGHVPAPFLGNHDMTRISGGDELRMKFLYGLLSMLNGSTFTYYGDEIGMTGLKVYGTDANVRTYMNWSNSDLAGRCDNPEEADPVNYLNEPLDIQKEDANSIYNYYKKANLLRNQIPAIARGPIIADESYDDSDDKFVKIVKEYSGEKIQILLNFDKQNEQIVSYKDSSAKQLVGQLVSNNAETIKVNEQQQKLLIPSFGIAILK